MLEKLDKYYFTIIALLILIFLSCLVYMYRNEVFITKNNLFKNDSVKILAKIEVPFGENKDFYTILKIRSANSLFLKIYGPKDQSGFQKSVGNFDLLSSIDARIQLGPANINLGGKDINQDNQMEILAPVIDSEGKAQIRIFSFNSSSGLFKEVSPLDLILDEQGS